MKLSDYVVQFFEGLQIKNIFMVSGGGCMHLLDSFGKSEKIRYISTHHEQAAAMAAEANAKMLDGLGLVLTTSGPGATNTVTGVLDCYQDSIPAVFLSGQSKHQQTVQTANIASLRQFGVQEGNIVPVVTPITKYAVEIDNPKMIRYCLERAVYEATSGRPGPVWISIPLDVQSANIDPKTLAHFVAEEKPFMKLDDSDAAYIINALCRAQRPVIIGGHGVRLARACDLLAQFAQKYQIPVVTPIMGIDVLADEHPCNIGRVGTKGTRAGNFAMQNADLILSVGSRLSVSVVGHQYDMFAREAKVIAVDVDRCEHLKKTIHIDRIVECDAKVFLEAMLETDSLQQSDGKWLDICNNWKKCYPVILDRYNDDSKGINYYKFVGLINDAMSPDMPVIADAGSAFYVVSQAISLQKGQRYITTGGTATMGFSLPAAIGVAAATPEHSVIAVTGEGSFMQNMQELAVLQYYHMKVKLFVMCNNGYFSIHQTQKKFFAGHFVGEGPDSGLCFPDFAKVADAFGVKYYRLNTIADCEAQLHHILREDGPAMITVNTSVDMSIIPTNASKMREDGVLISKPLEDMYPFLEREEFLKNMFVRPVQED